MGRPHDPQLPDQAQNDGLAKLPAREVRAVRPSADLDALRAAYLDLLKLCLCDLVGTGTQTISWTGDLRVFSRELTGDDQLEWRIAGRDWPLNALTMVGLRRLDDLQACVESVVRDRIPGDLIEAGAWRGGSSILMRATLDAMGAHDRAVWVADSFQGFPAPEQASIEEDRQLETELGDLGYLAPSLGEVQGHFARFGLEDGVRFVPGFFEETMDELRGRRWSLIRLDADTYKATRLTLEALYPGLAEGGYLISDDYGFLPACRRAVDEYREEHGITEPIEQIDYNGVRWRKERDVAALETQADEPLAGHSGTSQTRAAASHPIQRIPSDRELQLEEEVAALGARLEAVEAEAEALRGSPFAGPSAWWAGRRDRRGA